MIQQFYSQAYTPKNRKQRLNKDLYTNICGNTALEPKCLSIDGQMGKMWYIHKLEYYSAFKRKEILTHIATWRNLKSMKLTRHKRLSTTAFCTYRSTKSSQSNSQGLKVFKFKGPGEWRNWELVFSRYRVSVLDNKNFL